MISGGVGIPDNIRLSTLKNIPELVSTGLVNSNQLLTDLMVLENGIPDTPTARQSIITLANADRQVATTTRVFVSCTCKKVLSDLSLPML